jgi:hypothetical protein
MTRVLNFFAGPGTGKSTTSAAVFAELKYRGVNCEYIQEYAKDKAWEFGKTVHLPKVIQAQEYIFAKQHFRMRRCAGEVDLLICDSPLIMSMVYIEDDFELPSLRNVVLEAHNLYNNVNVVLERCKPYNPKGRFQDEEGAKQKDKEILDILQKHNIMYTTMKADRDCVKTIVDMLGY